MLISNTTVMKLCKIGEAHPATSQHGQKGSEERVPGYRTAYPQVWLQGWEIS